MSDETPFSTEVGDSYPQSHVDRSGDLGAAADTAADTAADIDAAAAESLKRAKSVAATRGFRPGSPAGRRPRPVQATFSSARSDARDPVSLGAQIDRLTGDRGWALDVAVGAIMSRWPTIVGANIARHVTPVTYDDGTLTIRADSTAWATQMRLLSGSLLEKIARTAGRDTVTTLKVTGPSAPSWSKGLRKTHGGRGARDTYG